MDPFTLKEDGSMVSLQENTLNMDTLERNQALVKEYGRIWDEVFLYFDQDMNAENTIIKLIEVTNKL